MHRRVVRLVMSKAIDLSAEPVVPELPYSRDEVSTLTHRTIPPICALPPSFRCF